MSFPALVEPASELTVDEVRRYSRHLIIPDVGMTGQKRLKNAKVLVVGAGGLGSPALLYLAAAGVGTLGIVDFDVVDESNLQRQIIHGQSDIGKPKARVGQGVDRGGQPASSRWSCTRSGSTRPTSSRSSRRTTSSSTARTTSRPATWSTTPPSSSASPTCGARSTASTARRRSSGPTPPAARRPATAASTPSPRRPAWCPSCAEGGVLGVLCASIGSIQVNEAIKLITGIGDPLVGRLMVYDALEMQYRSVQVRKDPECPVCGKNPEITLETGLIDYEAFCGTISQEAADAARGSTISVTDLKEMVDAGKDFYLVDVREPNEFEIVSIPGTTLIPKDRILYGEALGRPAAGQAGRPLLQDRACAPRRRSPCSRAPASPTRCTSAAASSPGPTRSTRRCRRTDGPRHVAEGPDDQSRSATFRARHRFELVVDGALAGFARYRREGDDVAFLHTEVDAAYEGQGLGSRLVAEALQQVADRGVGVLPYCPFVRAYLQQHRDLVRLVPADRRAEFDLEQSA